MMKRVFLGFNQITKRFVNFQHFSVFDKVKRELRKKGMVQPDINNELVAQGTELSTEQREGEIEEHVPNQVPAAPAKEKKKTIKGKVFELDDELKAIKRGESSIFSKEISISSVPIKRKMIKQAKRILKKEEEIRNQFLKEKVLIDELVNDIKLEKESQLLIELKPQNEVLSLYKRMEITEEFADGSIALLHIFDEKGDPKKFPDRQTYIEWHKRQLEKLKKRIKFKLNPRESWIMLDQGIEAPRTGEYWDNYKPGVYACKVCTQRLFSSTHKYDSKCGHATFWNYLPYAIDIRDGAKPYPEPTQAVIPVAFQGVNPVKRITCSNCETHIGVVFNDGPPPFFKRLLVNSSAVKFLDLGWFESPDERRLKKKIEKLKKEKERKEAKKLVFNRMEEANKKVIDNIKDSVNFEIGLNEDILTENYNKHLAQQKELESQKEVSSLEEPEQAKDKANNPAPEK